MLAVYLIGTVVMAIILLICFIAFIAYYVMFDTYDDDLDPVEWFGVILLGITGPALLAWCWPLVPLLIILGGPGIGLAFLARKVILHYKASPIRLDKSGA